MYIILRKNSCGRMRTGIGDKFEESFNTEKQLMKFLNKQDESRLETYEIYEVKKEWNISFKKIIELEEKPL